MGAIDLGLRSLTRFSPGYNRTGLQPSNQVNHKAHAGGILRLLITPKTAKNDKTLLDRKSTRLNSSH